MIKDLTKVIKTRWPEMILISGFMAIGWFIFEQLMAAAPSATAADETTSIANMSETTMFLYSMTSMIFFVISLTLLLGFLATLNVNPLMPHPPATLVSIGRFFFWRAIRLQILITIYYFSLAILILMPIKFLFFRTIPNEDIPKWVSFISVIIAFSILVKPLLLVLPIMICKNLVVLPALKLITNYRLSDIKSLPVIFIGGMLIAVVLTILQDKIPNTSVTCNVLFAAKSIIYSLVSLLTGVIGIWFIAGRRFGALQQHEETEETETLS